MRGSYSATAGAGVAPGSVIEAELGAAEGIPGAGAGDAAGWSGGTGPGSTGGGSPGGAGADGNRPPGPGVPCTGPKMWSRN